MKILFIPFHSISHKLPLLVLYKKYLSHLSKISCSFLLAKSDEKYVERYKVNILDFDNTLQNGLGNNSSSFNERKEKIIKQYNPDIIIEDFCFHAVFFCKKSQIPRISIQRTGFFRASNPSTRNPFHTHSSDKFQINYRRYPLFKYKKYIPESDILDRNYYYAEYILNNQLTSSDIHSPKFKIIPGVREIEMLPSNREEKSYLYSGPLVPDDYADSKLINDISRFLYDNKNRYKVLLTMGTIEQQDVSPIFNILHKRGYAVITTILPPYEVNKRYIFYYSFLPLHFVSENVDLIIHHCGSGIYHFPLLHLKPSITLGTQCYDREDIALRLQELNLSSHIPSPYDDSNYMEKFIVAIDSFEKGNLSDFRMLKRVNHNIIETMQNFDMEKLLNNIVSGKID